MLRASLYSFNSTMPPCSRLLSHLNLISIFNNKWTEWPLTVLCSLTMQQYIKHKIERIGIYKLKHLREV